MALATAYPHVTAFLGLLTPLASLSPTSVTAYLGGAPDDAVAPYLVAHPDAGTIEQTSLVPDQGFVGYISLVAVGTGPEQALWVQDAARALLVGAQPSVSGRHLWRIWQEPNPPPVQRDDDVTPPLYTSFAEYGVRSTPA